MEKITINTLTDFTKLIEETFNVIVILNFQIQFSLFKLVIHIK
jgi:hypothetical protein